MLKIDTFCPFYFVTTFAVRVAMDGNKNVLATFSPASATYRLTVRQPGNGKGNVRASPPGTKCGTACTLYPVDTKVTLSAKPTTPSSFTGWGGACSPAGTAIKCQLTMSGNKAVVANFATP